MWCIACTYFTCHRTQYQGTELLKCNRCGHICQDPLEASKAYDANYILDYFEHNSLRQMSLLRAGFVVAGCRHVSDEKNILDFGFGSGDFLRVIRKLGWNIFGHDIHNVDLGIQNLSETEILDKQWDCITFFDSLEHLENFNFIRKLQQKSNYFIISVPSTPKNFPDIKFDWKHFKPGEHLHYFSEKSLGYLFSDFNIVTKCNVEDAIRGSLNGNRNIDTYVLERK